MYCGLQFSGGRKNGVLNTSIPEHAQTPRRRRPGLGMSLGWFFALVLSRFHRKDARFLELRHLISTETIQNVAETQKSVSRQCSSKCAIYPFSFLMFSVLF